MGLFFNSVAGEMRTCGVLLDPRKCFRMDEIVSAAEQSANRLTAENLARDFGFGSPLTRTCLGELYRAILSERGKAAYADWLELFSRLWASAEKRLIAPLDSLKRKI